MHLAQPIIYIFLFRWIYLVCVRDFFFWQKKFIAFHYWVCVRNFLISVWSIFLLRHFKKTLALSQDIYISTCRSNTSINGVRIRAMTIQWVWPLDPSSSRLYQLYVLVFSCPFPYIFLNKKWHVFIQTLYYVINNFFE